MRHCKKSFTGQHGAATLVMTLVLLTLTTLLIVFAANYGKLQSKSIANINRNYQAYEAAQAGLEFGINYLNVNNSTVIASPVSGYINYSDSSTTNISLANSSKFSVVYTNPTANDYTVIKTTSTGTSDDGSSVHTVSQLVKFGSTLLNSPTVPLLSKGNISLGGSSEIINLYSNNTVQSGGTVSLTGASSTIISSGPSSTPGNIQSDIQANVGSLSSTSNSDLFASYFGLSTGSVKSSAQHYYSNSTDTSYGPTLSGMTGTSIWIDQTGGTATLNGNITIGSVANPVLLVVNGDVKFSGTVNIYGYVFVLGSSTNDLTGNVTITGSMNTTGSLNATGSIQVAYNPTVLSNLQNNSSMRYYAKIPGSWKDF